MVGLTFSETHIITVTISLLTLAFSLSLGNKDSACEETHLGKRRGCELDRIECNLHYKPELKCTYLVLGIICPYSPVLVHSHLPCKSH